MAKSIIANYQLSLQDLASQTLPLQKPVDRRVLPVFSRLRARGKSRHMEQGGGKDRGGRNNAETHWSAPRLPFGALPVPLFHRLFTSPHEVCCFFTQAGMFYFCILRSPQPVAGPEVPPVPVCSHAQWVQKWVRRKRRTWLEKDKKAHTAHEPRRPFLLQTLNPTSWPRQVP